jgi:hypothetical protein
MLAPAVAATRAEVTPTLNRAATVGPRRRRFWARNGLVAPR